MREPDVERTVLEHDPRDLHYLESEEHGKPRPGLAHLPELVEKTSEKESAPHHTATEEEEAEVGEGARVTTPHLRPVLWLWRARCDPR